MLLSLILPPAHRKTFYAFVAVVALLVAAVNVGEDGGDDDYAVQLDAHENVESVWIAVLGTCHRCDLNLNHDMGLVSH